MRTTSRALTSGIRENARGRDPNRYLAEHNQGPEALYLDTKSDAIIGAERSRSTARHCTAQRRARACYFAKGHKIKARRIPVFPHSGPLKLLESLTIVSILRR
jgi:hypothetical protein